MADMGEEILTNQTTVDPFQFSNWCNFKTIRTSCSGTGGNVNVPIVKEGDTTTRGCKILTNPGNNDKIVVSDGFQNINNSESFPEGVIHAVCPDTTNETNVQARAKQLIDNYARDGKVAITKHPFLHLGAGTIEGGSSQDGIVINTKDHQTRSTGRTRYNHETQTIQDYELIGTVLPPQTTVQDEQAQEERARARLADVSSELTDEDRTWLIESVLMDQTQDEQAQEERARLAREEQERAQEERAQNPTFDATWSDWADAPEIQWNDNH